MAIAKIEPYAGALRVWEDDDAAYGDEPQWSATLRWLDFQSVEITLVTSPLPPSFWRAIRSEMDRINVKQVLIVRYVDGKRKLKLLPVKK